MESRREICTLESCHLGPPAPGSRRSAATSPCPQDGAWVLPGSSKQYSQVNICHRQISSLIKPSQVSSASVPGQPEKLTQATELLRKKVKWQRPWGGGVSWDQPWLRAGWEEGGSQLLSLKTSELPKAVHLDAGVCPTRGGLIVGRVRSRTSHHSPLEVFHGSLPPWAADMVLMWGCCLRFQNPSACLCVGRRRSPAPRLKEQQVHLQRNGHGCPSSALGSTGAAAGPWGRGVACCHYGGGGNQQLSPSPNNHNLPRARFT